MKSLREEVSKGLKDIEGLTEEEKNLPLLDQAYLTDKYAIPLVIFNNLSRGVSYRVIQFIPDYLLIKNDIGVNTFYPKQYFNVR